MSSHSSNSRLEITLNRISEDIVNILGYTGCMVAVKEEDGALPVRAFYIDPKLASVDQITNWETKVSSLLGRPLSLSNPEVARICIDDASYKENLSYKAYHKQDAEVSNELFTLLTPIVPSAAKPLVNRVIQHALRIKQVVAVPFFLDLANSEEKKIVGNLFAAKNSEINQNDINILMSYGQHAAAAIEIEHHRTQVFHVAKHLTTEIQTNIRRESEMLQQIVEGVVNVLGYIGAMVATYNKEDDSLPVKAFYVDPKLASVDQIKAWEDGISTALRKKVSITDPKIAKVYVNDEKYRENLSVQAVQSVSEVVSQDLSSLLVPIVPVNTLTKPIISLIQKTLGISQVIAIPFFLRAPDGNDPQIMGNLFVATTNQEGFQNEEIQLLQAFGQQASAGIFNAQLYREIDEQRQVAQVFATMAFSASKSIHQFRNDIGFIRGQLQLLPYIEEYEEKQRQEILSSTPKVIERIDNMSARLNQLHEPWRPVKQNPTNINTCLINAREKVIPEHSSNFITVSFELSPDIPLVTTSSDMLTEAFRIIIKNSVEAIYLKSNTDGKIEIKTELRKRNFIGVKIVDNGIGIKKEDLNSIFKMGWTTKESGLGFGLFWTNDFLTRLGGIVNVQSDEGFGTIFRILVPRNPFQMTTDIGRSSTRGY